jgi:hypothetical protein
MAADYERDVLLWSAEQARLIRSGQFDKLDIDHIADEIEDVGKNEKRELASHMSALLAHILKWQFHPSRRGTSWDRTMRERRKQVIRKLQETPSLKRLLIDADWVAGVWGDAVTIAISETGLDAFPDSCPWRLSDLLDDGWLPPACKGQRRALDRAETPSLDHLRRFDLNLLLAV